MTGILNSFSIEKLRSFIYTNNILWILIVIAILYVIYKIATAGFTSFQDYQDLTDLLQRQKVSVFETYPLWDNMLYNEQLNKKENPISFWYPSFDTGDSLKQIGTCVSTDKEYSVPQDFNTLLVKGDTRPPVRSELVFSFPDNIITSSTYNSAGTSVSSVFTGIRNMADIDKRLEYLRTQKTLLNEKYGALEGQFNGFIKSVEDMTLNRKIEVCSKDTFFVDPAHIYTVKPGETIKIESGRYSTLRLPVGCKVKLKSSTGATLDFEIPYDCVLNDTKDNYKYNGIGPTYNDILKSIKGTRLTVDDFNPIGKYGFKAHDLLPNVNDNDYSSEATDFNQTETQAYMPHSHNEEIGLGGIYKKKVRYSYNFAISNGPENHNMYGRDMLFQYYQDKMDNAYIVDGQNNHNIDFRAGNNYMNFSNTEDLYFLQTPDKANNITNLKVTVTNPMIHRENINVPINMSFADDFKNTLKASLEDPNIHNWYNVDMSKLMGREFTDIINNNNTIGVRNFYVDFAFMLTTYRKKLKKSGGVFATDVMGLSQTCCEVYNKITEESLSRNPKFQGYLTGGTVTSTIDPALVPAYKYIRRDYDYIINALKGVITELTAMTTQLETLKSSIAQNNYNHLPMKIYRPIAPDDYVCLGDVLINNTDANYKAREILLTNIACVPNQCVSEKREWLPVDKVWEHKAGDSYVAIYRNPYLKTFKAVTRPGMLPEGKVVKVVACVEKCRLLDDIIEADKCANNFYNANKSLMTGLNLDDNGRTISSKETALYKNEISKREDKLNALKEVARRIEGEDIKADIVNKELNKHKLQSLVDTQGINMSKLLDKLERGKGQIDLNLNTDYVKFNALLDEIRVIAPQIPIDKIQTMFFDAAKKKLSALPADNVTEILEYCPSAELKDLVYKKLVSSACFNCNNLN